MTTTATATLNAAAEEIKEKKQPSLCMRHSFLLAIWK
jgi:hypothetical protein